MKYIKKQKGFAIVETLAVLVALSLLGYFGYLSWSINGQKNRDTERIENVNNLHKELVVFLEENKEMPKNQDEFKPTCSNDSNFLVDLGENSLAKKISDSSGHEYCYFDYGGNTIEGAVVGIKLERLFIEESPCPESTKLDWCLDTYYCLCQPYQYIKK